MSHRVLGDPPSMRVCGERTTEQVPLWRGPDWRAQRFSLWNVSKGPAGRRHKPAEQAGAPRTKLGLWESLWDLQGQGRAHESRGTVHLRFPSKPT